MNTRDDLECVQINPHFTIYNPALLLDSLLQKLELATDRELATLIGLTPSAISKIRARRAPVSAALLVRINEITDVRISDIRALMGERRTRQSGSDDFLNRGRRAGD
jgi:transcriptional regulator with XRE-family HTH domain